ncbi:MAG: hypothetical protein IPJ69_13075 [Deltaproteobacteria bacterium]|nr:MAG: hypothetical protein IPJ69_13075 [Deltaproteobacteria bacterium]
MNSLSNDNLIYLSELFESEENDTVPLAELRYSDFEHKSRILFDEILLSSFGNPDMILKAREFISILLFSRGLDASDSIERAVLFHTPEAQGLLRFYYYSRLYVLHTHAGIAPNELLRPHLYESLRSYAAYHASLDTRSQCHFLCLILETC